MGDQFKREAAWVVVGSGVAGPQVLVTSGMRVDRGAAGVIWEMRWNMTGTANSGYVPAGYPPFAAGAQSLQVPLGGTASQPILGTASTSPLVGGSPAGTIAILGSSDGVYYTPLPVSVSGLYGVSASGTRIIGVSGAMPDWMQFVYSNTTSSGVFDISFAQRSYGG
jgi:hypothetical protein